MEMDNRHNRQTEILDLIRDRLLTSYLVLDPGRQTCRSDGVNASLILSLCCSSLARKLSRAPEKTNGALADEEMDALFGNANDIMILPADIAIFADDQRLLRQLHERDLGEKGSDTVGTGALHPAQQCSPAARVTDGGVRATAAPATRRAKTRSCF